MAVSNAQVRKLMEEYQKGGKIGRAAMLADMDRKTARKYVRFGKLPSEMRKPHMWRTRPDPFEQDWTEIEKMLSLAPELEATTIFEFLQGRDPGRYEPGQASLQRRCGDSGDSPQHVEVCL